MTDRVPTPGKEGRVKLTFDDESVQYAKIEMADEPTQEGTPLNKTTLLSDSTAEILGFGADDDPTVNDAFLAIPTCINTGWKLLWSKTTAGSGTWQVPDLFGDGRQYTVGVFIIGAGASGTARTAPNSWQGNEIYAPGGSSGYTLAFLMKVTPGASYSYVVGAGGSAVAATTGNNGGSSSFNSKVAEGGGAGKVSENNTANAGAGGQVVIMKSGANPYGGIIGITGFSSDNSLLSDILSCFNPFTGERILGAGGSASGFTSPQAYPAGKNKITGLGGGNAATSTSATANVSGQKATEPGCGGGAALRFYPSSSSVTGTTTSGAGADGAVYIYVQGEPA